MKPWTLCLITSIMIAVIFTFLTLLVIMRDKIRELFSSCFGGRKDRIESEKMENFEVESQPLKEEIYSTPKEREPPICVSIAEACVIPRELTLREKMEVIEEEFRLGRIERERESKLRDEEIDRKYEAKDQAILRRAWDRMPDSFEQLPDGKIKVKAYTEPHRERRDSGLSEE